MKMLTHRIPIGSADPFNLATVKEHLIVDFSDADAEIAILARSSALELEHFAQIALLNQTIRVTLFSPPVGPSGMQLPIGPTADDAVATVLIDGAVFSDFRFVPGPRPYIHWGESYRASEVQWMTIEYIAGFGAAHDDIPSDLMQAVMDQVALQFDSRGSVDHKMHTTSPHLTRIGAKYRGVRA
ncbi:MAG: hypothetical protein AAGI03_04685 [Pseudomonadota bacterium]